MERYAWKATVKEGMLEEYIRRHDNIWPEMKEMLRKAGIRTQIHAEQKKFKQKLSYADKLAIPYAVFLGEDEINAGVVACKDMKTGEQTKLEPAATIYRIKAGLAELEKGSVILG